MDYVVDASVVTKWFVEEDYSQNARDLLKSFGRGSVDLYAPSLLLHEVGNALWRIVNRLKLLKATYVIDAYSNFLKVPIHYADLTKQDASDSLKLSLELGLTFYDVVYLNLSKKLAKMLVTADDEILRKIKGDFRVAHLREIAR